MKVSGWGYYETVKRYVEQYGADVNAKSDNGITPLMEAARGGNSDVIHYLLQRGADARVWTVDHKNILYFATIRCDSQTLADLIAAGAEVNPPNGSGYVPLNKAAETGRMDIIKFLVNGYHAQVNLRDAAGYTALMLASAQGHLDIVKLLIEEYGAEINLKSDSGWTALLMAAWSNAPEVTKYLLERGADTAARDPDNRTALHLAVDRRDYPAVAALLAAGVDVNARGWAGETAIYYVVADVKPHLHGGMEILKLLVESGADLTIRSDAGQTVLDIADERREQRPDIYNYLHSVAGNQ